MMPTTICVKCANYEDRTKWDKFCHKYERNIADTIVIECDYFINKKEAAQ